MEKTITEKKIELTALERKAAIAKVDDILQTAKPADIIKLEQNLRTDKVNVVNNEIQNYQYVPIALELEGLALGGICLSYIIKK